MLQNLGDLKMKMNKNKLIMLIAAIFSITSIAMASPSGTCTRIVKMTCRVCGELIKEESKPLPQHCPATSIELPGGGFVDLFWSNTHRKSCKGTHSECREDN